jgi:hypothetical protein
LTTLTLRIFDCEATGSLTARHLLTLRIFDCEVIFALHQSAYQRVFNQTAFSTDRSTEVLTQPDRPDSETTSDPSAFSLSAPLAGRNLDSPTAPHRGKFNVQLRPSITSSELRFTNTCINDRIIHQFIRQYLDDPFIHQHLRRPDSNRPRAYGSSCQQRTYIHRLKNASHALI